MIEVLCEFEVGDTIVYVPTGTTWVVVKEDDKNPDRLVWAKLTDLGSASPGGWMDGDLASFMRKNQHKDFIKRISHNRDGWWE